MITVLAADAAVSPGVVNITGWVLGLGGILLAALWLLYLYR